MVSNSPRTWLSGKSAPDDTDNQRMSLLSVVATSFVLFPFPAFIAAATYQIGLVWLRLRVGMLFAAAGVAILLWWIVDGNPATYVTPYKELLSAVADRNVPETISDRWLYWLLVMLPFSFATGVPIGAIYSGWRWHRRPRWDDDNRRPYPWVNTRIKRTRRNIAAGIDGPAAALTLGLNPETGERIVQTDPESGAHTLVTGGSGTGKTTAILMQMRDVIRIGRGLVVIDLKGSDEVPAHLAMWAKRHNRTFHHWSLHSTGTTYHGPARNGLSYYEPIGRGDATRKAGMLLATREWSVEADHYKKVVEGFLQTTFNLLARLHHSDAAVGDPIAEMVAMMTDPNHLMDRAEQLFDQTKTSHTTSDWHGGWDTLDDPDLRNLFRSVASYLTLSANRPTTIDVTIRNFGQALSTFQQSVAGPWLRSHPDDTKNIDLERVAREGHVVVFSLNSATYPEPALAVGTMIVQDLKTVSAQLRADPNWFHSTRTTDRLHVFVDEFGTLKADNTKTLLQQVRDARIAVTLSTQSLGDLAYHSPEFKQALLNTVGSFFALRPNTHDESVELAGLTGGQMRQVKQVGIEQASSIGGIDVGAATGTGFLREEMGFTIEPHIFQSLKIGEGIYISSAGGQRRTIKVDVVREDDSDTNRHTTVYETSEKQGSERYVETSGNTSPLFPANTSVTPVTQPDATDTPPIENAPDVEPVAEPVAAAAATSTDTGWNKWDHPSEVPVAEPEPVEVTPPEPEPEPVAVTPPATVPPTTSPNHRTPTGAWSPTMVPIGPPANVTRTPMKTRTAPSWADKTDITNADTHEANTPHVKENE